MLIDPKFIKSQAEQGAAPDEHNSLKTAIVDFNSLRMDCKPYYPNQSLFEIMIPRELLKKNLSLKKIH